MFGGYSESKLKPQLKMAVSRFGIASNKKSALLKQNMRAVAVLLAEDPPKEEKARIKAEALIRDDHMLEAFDILSLNCDLLSERIKLITHSKECPPDLVSSVSTLIYAAPRLDIPELVTIRKQFRSKYGKKFEDDAMSNAGGVLNERVVTKLSVQPPAAYLVQTYLEQICEKHEVSWSPTVKLKAENMGEPMAPPSGFSVPIGAGTGLGPVIATTGQTVISDDITYDGTGAPSNDFLMPVAPGAATTTTSTAASVSKSSAPESIPWGAPEVPKSSAPAPRAPAPSKKDDFADDFAEPDIFIPAAPGSSAASNSIPPSAPSAPKNDDDDDDEKPQDGGSGTQSTFDDLAARFDNLKTL